MGDGSTFIFNLITEKASWSNKNLLQFGPIMWRVFSQYQLFIGWCVLCTCKGSGVVVLDQIDLNKELILTDVDEIKAFFKYINSKASESKPEETSATLDKKAARESGRAFLNGGTSAASPPGQGGTGTLGGLFGGATTNILTAAGTIFGAAAAAGQQAVAAQQTGGVITAMSPAQQILNMRSCPANNSSVCAPAAQCLLAGGVSVGNCAMGLLVCCTQRQEIPYTCSSTNNLVTIRDKLSAVASNDVDRSCQFEIYKSDPNICQLQLDFDTFELEPPLWGEDCSSDSVMTISDSVTVRNGFPLCGKHNGTRIHLAYGRSSRITLAFMKSSKSSYRIRIRQIECNSADRIPDQCLQNHEGYSGLVKSFGFPLYMVNNQKYTVCINAKAVGDNGKITWRECSNQEAGSDSEHNFMMSEYFVFDPPLETINETETYYNYYNYYSSTDASLFIPTEGFSCSKSTYVEIHGEDKHCGARFMARGKYLRSESRPYMLTVNVVEDSAENVPDFAIYRIVGLRRSTPSSGIPDPIPPNECENSWNSTSTDPVMVPSTQGFEPCKLLTKHKVGNVQYDLCVCYKKDATVIPDKPKTRPDLLERKGFCLHYSVS